MGGRTDRLIGGSEDGRQTVAKVISRPAISYSLMNALVTGASAGIGREMVFLLAARGYHVVLVARREERLEELVDDLPYGSTVIAQDLALPGAAQKLWETCRQKELSIDVLVNNAGFGKLGPHHDLELEDIERMNHLNITCLSSLCRLFGEQMKRRGQGCILNVGSITGYLPIPYFANYAASKAFVSSLTRALRTELRPHGVQVCLLNPGSTATEFGEIAQPGANYQKGKPQTMQASEVAEAGIVGLFADHAEIIPGPLNQALPLIVRLVPKSMLIRGAAHLMRSRMEG